MIALPNVPRTYPHAAVEAWSDEDWRRIPPQPVPTHALIPTQAGVSLERIVHFLNGGEPETGDYGRAILHDGSYYLHDGHHRWLLALIRGEASVLVRVANQEATREA